MRIGIAHHFGWAVAVAATGGDEVFDRRRIELVEPGLPAAPIHHEGGPHRLHARGAPLSDDALATLVAEVRASALRSATIAFDELAAAGAPSEPIVSVSVRAWPPGFPTDIAVMRRSPHEARADSVMYCQVLAEAAGERGWPVHLYDAKAVEQDAARLLGPGGDEALRKPRELLGPPWGKDHRTAFAATVVAGRLGS